MATTSPRSRPGIAKWHSVICQGNLVRTQTLANRSDLRVGVVLDERAELLTELSVARAAARQPAQHGPQARPRASHAPSKTFSTAIVMDFQCCFSRASCFCPAFVIE